MSAPTFRYRDRRQLRLRLLAALSASLLLHGSILVGVEVRRLGASRVPAAPRTVRMVAREQRDALPAEPAADLAVVPGGSAASQSPAASPAPAAHPAAASPAAAPIPDAASTAALPLAIDPTYYTWREVDVPAKLLGDGSPPYPREAAEARLAGVVRLEVWIDETGRVAEAQILGAIPPGVFDQATLEHYRALRFVPALKNGVAVRSRLRFVVEFRRETDAVTAPPPADH